MEIHILYFHLVPKKYSLYFPIFIYKSKLFGSPKSKQIFIQFPRNMNHLYITVRKKSVGLTKGIYNRLPLIMSYLLDINSSL